MRASARRLLFILAASILTATVGFAAAGNSPIQGLAPGGIYHAPVTIRWADPVADAGLTMLLNGKPVVPGTTISEDGHYLLEFRSSGPLTRPVSVAPVSFTIDRTAPKISFERPSYLPKGALPRVRVVDANAAPDTLNLFLDGKPYDRSQAIAPGEHLFEATVSDRAGNVANASTVGTFGFCSPTTFYEYKPATTLLSAVHYYPWYTGSPECPANTKWCNCVWGPKPENPRPAHGFYDSANQAVVSAQLDQMIANGIDVVALEWSGETLNRSNLENVVIPAIASRNIQFVLQYDTLNRLNPGHSTVNFDDATIRNQFVLDFQNFASSASYFKNSKYLKFANEPVIYVYVTRAILGTDANIQAAFDAIHQAAKDNGFSELYLVADHLFWNNSSADWHRLSLMGPKAATSFSGVSIDQGVSQGSASRPVRTWADKLANLYSGSLTFLGTAGIVDLTPGIFVQYDDSGLGSSACFSRATTQNYRLLDGSDWAYMIQTAGLNRAYTAELHTILPDCRETVSTTGTNGMSVVWTYSYNEWYEGAGIEELTPRTSPYPFGFGLEPLQILKQNLP